MKVKNIELPYIMTIEEFEEDEKQIVKKQLKRKDHISKKTMNTFPKFKRRDKRALFFKALREVPSVKLRFYAIDQRENFKDRLDSIKKIISIDSINPYLLDLRYPGYGLGFVHFASGSKDFFYGKPVKAGYVDGLNLHKRDFKFIDTIQLSSPENKYKKRKEASDLTEAYELLYIVDESHEQDSIDFSLENADYKDFSSTEPKKGYLEMNKPYFGRDLWDSLSLFK